MSSDDLVRTSTAHRTSRQVHCYIGELAVLMDVESGEYFEVNAVGSQIWRLLEAPMTVNQLIERLLAEFDVEPEQCEADVRLWLGKMRDLGFIEWEPADR